MKSFRLLGKIFAALLVALGFNGCKEDSVTTYDLSDADCIICTDYANDTYQYCKADFVSYGVINTWEDYVDYLSNYFDIAGNKGCKKL